MNDGNQKKTSTSIIHKEKSMKVEVHLTMSEAAELYEAAQRLRKLTRSPLMENQFEKDILNLCDFIQENI